MKNLIKNIKSLKVFRLTMMGSMMLFGIGACTDQLDLTPTSEITVSGFWVTEDNARGALNGMYVRFRDEASNNFFMWGESRAETLSYGLQASQGLERYFENTLEPVFAGPTWLRLYTTLHDANLIIKYVPNIDFKNQSTKNDLLAQAYTMRAYLYFVMARTWGGVPLVTDPTEGYDAETTFREKAPVGEIFALIKSDIDQAMGLFSNNDLPKGKATWSKPALNALKGDVYLWTGKVLAGGQQDFQTALGALNEVAGTNVSLEGDFDRVFRYNNKGNQEILFAVQFKDLESGTNYNANMYIRDDEIPGNTPADTKAKLGLGGGLNRWAPSPVLRASFSDKDIRKETTFLSIVLTNAEGNSSHHSSAVMKYRGFVDPSGRRFLDDVILYRFADVLLMIAEAKNALGQDPSQEINQIRQRAYGLNFEDFRFVNGSKVQNDEAILQERLLELAFEGKRWWDLVRFDKAFEKVPSLKDRANQRHLLLWPISQSTLSLNSKIIQNPGYGN